MIPRFVGEQLHIAGKQSPSAPRCAFTLFRLSVCAAFLQEKRAYRPLISGKHVFLFLLPLSNLTRNGWLIACTVVLCAMRMTAIAVMMAAVVIAVRIRVIFKITGRKRLCRFVGRTMNAGKQFDTSISQRHLRSHADAAADQCVRFCCLQETCKCSVSAAVGIHDLFLYNFTVFDVVEFEVLGMAEVLKDFSVFISDRDSHNMISFDLDFLWNVRRWEMKGAADDQKPPAVCQHIRHRSSGTLADCCHGRS